MYRIYYNDRLLTLTNKWDACADDPNAILYKVTKKSDIPAQVQCFLTQTQLLHPVLLSDDLPALLEGVCTGFPVYREAAGGLVRNAAGEVLMIFRNNRWDLPKGHCEAGERVEETALREVAEECGISGMQLQRHLTDTFHVYREQEQAILKRTAWYAMHYSGSEQPVPQVMEGITRAEWITPAQLPELLAGSYQTIRQVFAAVS